MTFGLSDLSSRFDSLSGWQIRRTSFLNFRVGRIDSLRGIGEKGNERGANGKRGNINRYGVYLGVERNVVESSIGEGDYASAAPLRFASLT
jgi:hypothetical protein